MTDTCQKKSVNEQSIVFIINDNMLKLQALSNNYTIKDTLKLFKDNLDLGIKLTLLLIY